MDRNRSKFLAILALLACGRPAGAAPDHDLFLCAETNSHYVVGSKLLTPNGIFHRAADGSFEHLGLNYAGIFSVAFDPRDPRIIYAAAINGCLQTLDGGKTWRIDTSWDMTEPRDVCVDPGSPGQVYLALPDGVAVSADRGSTWVRRENGLPDRGKFTQVIAVDRTRPGRVLAGCESGIYLTENGADSWRRVLPTAATVDDIRQSPSDPALWLAVTQADGALISRDRGDTWRRIAGVPSVAALYNASFDATHPQRMAISSWTYGVITTEDGGRTWTFRNAGLPAGHAIYRLDVDPDTGRLYANVYGDALYVSDDFGLTWKRTSFLDCRIYHFLFAPRK